jgi:D-glycero-beta-D-manno-heptose-7-phosphate kinase
MNVAALFDSFRTIKVGVIGDVMLDTYMWGHVERISPEAPVPVVSLDHKEQRIGGAGNVALNLQSLGAKAWVISVTGNDEAADEVSRLYESSGIDGSYMIRSQSRLTTNKTRIISRNQQMMRLDAEITSDLDAGEEEALLHMFENFLKKEKPQIVVLEDYNKGVLTENVIHEVIAMCRTTGVLTAVDPKRKHFFEYRNADIFKPNLKEVKEALNLLFTDAEPATLQKIHGEINQFLHHQISFITLSEKGVFYQQENNAAVIPSHVRNVADVSGAGDTVIAVAALVYAATKNVHLMAEIANIAGGLVCEIVGTAAIDKEKLMHECELLLS